jgi:hypothetical protein
MLHLWESSIPKINPLITLAENGIRQILKPIENDRLTLAGLTAAQAMMRQQNQQGLNSWLVPSLRLLSALIGYLPSDLDSFPPPLPHLLRFPIIVLLSF